MTSLSRAGARGGGITLLGQVARMAIQLSGVVILARLLSPEDFGLIAMVAVFVALADLFRDFGMPSAALQAKELSHQQASNMFWLSTALGTATSLALVALTPLIVALYDEPRLGWIVPALAFTLFLGGAQAQLQVQLARRMQFVTLAVAAAVAPLVGLVAAIVAALIGWGYWALVAQLVVTSAVLLLIQAIGARWLPVRPRRGHGSRALVTSGAQIGVAYALTWAASNIDTLLIGARWGATALGYYNRAFQLTAAPVGSFLSPLTQVAIPYLNRTESAGQRNSDVLLRVQFVVAAPIVVLMTALALVAPSVVPLVLGDQWAPAIPLVQILAVAEAFHALSFVSFWGFLAERLSAQLLYYNLATKPVAVALVIVGSNFGVQGVAWGYVAGLAVSWPINVWWLSRRAAFDGWAFIRRGTRLLGAALLTWSALRVALGGWLDERSWGASVVGILAVGAVFTILTVVFPSGRRDLGSIWAVVKAVRGR